MGEQTIICLKISRNSTGDVSLQKDLEICIVIKNLSECFQFILFCTDRMLDESDLFHLLLRFPLSCLLVGTLTFFLCGRNRIQVRRLYFPPSMREAARNNGHKTSYTHSQSHKRSNGTRGDSKSRRSRPFRPRLVNAAVTESKKKESSSSSRQVCRLFAIHLNVYLILFQKRSRIGQEPETGREPSDKELSPKPPIAEGYWNNVIRQQSSMSGNNRKSIQRASQTSSFKTPTIVTARE